MHYAARFGAHGKSYALLTDADDVSTAVFFVHGFMGRATTTWARFQTMVDHPNYEEVFKSSDLFFFDYKSTRLTIPKAANDLTEFVEKLLKQGPFKTALEGVALPGLPRSGSVDADWEKYKRILFVGHSLGGVLVRRSILSFAKPLESAESTTPTLPPVLSQRPLLFAPAHLGFRHSGAVESLTGLHPMLSFAMVLWQVLGAKSYNDLKENSVVLTGLREGTVAKAKDYPACRAFRALLVWGDRDHFVIDDGYETDPDGDRLPHIAHSEICKPTFRYPEPLKRVARALE